MSMENHEAVAFIEKKAVPVHRESRDGFGRAFLARRPHDRHLDGAAHTAVVSSFLTVLSNK